MSSQMSPLTLGSQFDHASSNGLSRPCKRIKCHRPTPSSPSSLVAPSTVSTSAASAVSLIDTQSITNALTMAARNDCPSDNVFQLMRQWTRSPVIAAVARIEEDDVDDDEELDEDEANEMNERTHVDDDEDVEDDLDRDMNGSHSSGSELAGDIKCAKSNLTLGKPSGKSCTTRHLNHKSNRHSRRSLTPNHVQSGNLSRTRTNNFSIDSILTSSQKHSFHLPNPLYNISNVNPFDSSAATTIATRLASIDHFNNSFDSINRLPHHHHHPHHHHLPPLSPFQHLTHLSQLQQLKQQLTHLSPATAAAAAAAAAAAVSLNFHPGSLMTTNASRHPDSNHHLIHHAHSTPTNSDYSDHVNHHSHLLSSRSAAAFVDRFTGTSLPSNQSSSPLDRICSASSVYLNSYSDNKSSCQPPQKPPSSSSSSGSGPTSSSVAAATAAITSLAPTTSLPQSCSLSSLSGSSIVAIGPSAITADCSPLTVGSSPRSSTSPNGASSLPLLLPGHPHSQSHLLHLPSSGQSGAMSATDHLNRLVSRKKCSNRGPRIPFSGEQVCVLERKFKECHYLSSFEVINLSEQLNLTEARVKIWFQNRRARLKRELKTKN